MAYLLELIITAFSCYKGRGPSTELRAGRREKGGAIEVGTDS
jgi:hypothetical protein